MTVEADIQAFLEQELMSGAGLNSVSHDDDLLVLGIVDSHGIVELVSFLDERFGVSIADHDLTPENFSSISRIARLVASRMPDNSSVR